MIFKAAVRGFRAFRHRRKLRHLDEQICHITQQLGKQTAERFGCTPQAQRFLENLRDGAENTLFFNAILGACASALYHGRASPEYHLWQHYVSKMNDQQASTPATKSALMIAAKNVKTTYPHVRRTYTQSLKCYAGTRAVWHVEPAHRFITHAQLLLAYAQARPAHERQKIERQISHGIACARRRFVDAGSLSYGMAERLANFHSPAQPEQNPALAKLFVQLRGLVEERIRLSQEAVQPA